MQIYRWNRQSLSISLFFFFSIEIEIEEARATSSLLLPAPWRPIPPAGEDGTKMVWYGPDQVEWKVCDGGGNGGMVLVEPAERDEQMKDLPKLPDEGRLQRLYRLLTMLGMLRKGLGWSGMAKQQTVLHGFFCNSLKPKVWILIWSSLLELHVDLVFSSPPYLD